MNDCVIATQILSATAPANLSFAGPAVAAEIARGINEDLRKAVNRRPERFAAFAELSSNAAAATLKELRCCVKEMGFVGAMLSGSVGSVGEYVDSPRFDEVLSAFEKLNVPLYLHPVISPKAGLGCYYSFPDNKLLILLLADPGWSWHTEVAKHMLQLVVSGTLDRYSILKIVIGRQGEMLPMMLQRFDSMFGSSQGLQRSAGEALRRQV